MRRREATVPIYLVERRFAEQFAMPDGYGALAAEYEEIHDITWLSSFLSADKKKTYCLYEVDDIEILRKHAADLGLPIDSIVEVSELTR